MKKDLAVLTYFLGISFLLLGLQSSLYFLPVPPPAFWYIIFTYCCFKKNLLFNLAANIFHVLILSSFTTVSIPWLLLELNLISFVLFLFQDRFHTTGVQISLASGLGYFFLMSLHWVIESINYGFSFPALLDWFLISLVTTGFTPLAGSLLSAIDTWMHYESVDTLQNLRV